MRFSKVFFATFIALAGCKTQVSTDLFTSDLIAATQGENITAPLVIAVESATQQKCEETATAILKAVKTRHKEAEFIGCERESFDTFARFRVQATVISFSGDAPIPDDAFAIGVSDIKNSFEVSYLTNPDAAQSMWQALPQEITKFQSFDFKTSLSAVLNNDLQDKVEVTTDDVFADGTPIQGTVTRDLPRRDQIELKMSNVTNAAFGANANAAHIASFSLEK